MSITRKMLKGMGLTDEQMDSVLEAHAETLNEIKAERDRYKEDAERLPGVQKQLDDLKADGDGGYKAKYDAEHKAFETYKAEVAEKAAVEEKKTLYRAALKAAGVDEKRFDAIVRATDLSAVAVKDGKLEDEKAVGEAIKRDWGDFIPATTVQYQDAATPPKADPAKPAPNKRAAEIAAAARKSLYGEIKKE